MRGQVFVGDESVIRFGFNYCITAARVQHAPSLPVTVASTLLA